MLERLCGKRASKQRKAIKKQLLDTLYGFINGVMVIPVMISFASIIFRDAYFKPYMPILVRLVMFSALVHQLSFTALSSLPFAIGQVQDAGLIFLSAMTSSIAATLSDQPESVLPTCLFTMSMATALLGLSLVAVGRVKLAAAVQYIPMPVIGGYLAFIGFFCAEAGVAMMSDVTINRWQDWLLVLTPSKLVFVAPGVISGCSMYILLPLLRSPVFLPACLLTMVAAFYLVLAVTGGTLQSARAAGWVAPLTPSAPFYAMWEPFRPSEVVWTQVLAQAGRWAAMTIVVGFSSCLDVAAIEMESSAPLDFNKELQTVGWSNMLSGCAGGFTGSYIFTQTVFSMRRGVTSRLCGLFCALTELCVVLLPVPIICYMPKFIFGSLLSLIAADLIVEWLVLAQFRMAAAEYGVCVGTFLAMVTLGVQLGLGLGVLAAMVLFVVTYASSPALSVTSLQQSRVVRSYRDRCALFRAHGSIVRVRPEGYVFFGTAVRLLEEIQKNIYLQSTASSSSSRSTTAASTPLSSAPLNPFAHLACRDVSNAVSSSLNAPVYYQQSDPLPSPFASLGSLTSLQNTTAEVPVLGDSNCRVEFVVLDFSRVSGVDATAARACFLLLARLLEAAEVTCVYTEMIPRVEHALRAHGVISEGPRRSSRRSSSCPAVRGFVPSVVIPALEDALEWCEDCLLARLRPTSSNGAHSDMILLEPQDNGHSRACTPRLGVQESVNFSPGSSSSPVRTSYMHLLYQYLGSYVDGQSQRERGGGGGEGKRDGAERHTYTLAGDHEHDSLLQMVSRTQTENDAASAPIIGHISQGKEWANLCRILDSYLGPDLSLIIEYNNPSTEEGPYEGVFTVHGSLLQPYFRRTRLVRGQMLYEAGEAADLLFVLETGAVELVTTSSGELVRSGYSSSCSDSGVQRVCKMSAGCLCGEAEFLLRKPYSLRCYAITDVTAWTISHSDFLQLQRYHSELFLNLQQVLLRSLSIAQLFSNFHLHPSTAYHIVFK